MKVNEYILELNDVALETEIVLYYSGNENIKIMEKGNSGELMNEVEVPRFALAKFLEIIENV